MESECVWAIGWDGGIDGGRAGGRKEARERANEHATGIGESERRVDGGMEEGSQVPRRC